MSVKIRLFRVGRKHQGSFRIVAQDTKTKKGGRFLEILGSFNPAGSDKKIIIKGERLNFWLSRGAKATEAVAKILKTNGRSS